MHVLFILVFIFISLALSQLLLRERGIVYPLRSIVLILALAVVLTFNLNWLFHVPVYPWTLLLFFVAGIISVSIYRRQLSFGNISRRDARKWIIPFLLVIFSVFAGWIYFHQDFVTPRYVTPDSGTHFLYMRLTAETGLMPLFNENKMYPASGYMPEFKNHQQAYLPGSTAIFSIINSFISPDNYSTSFQLFNVICYGILAAYLFLFVLDRRLVKKHWWFTIPLGILLFFGVFFYLIATSFSAQLGGLIFLIFFIDTYDAYLKGGERALVPALGLAALAISYFYWLPIAVLFVILEFLHNPKKIFFIALAPAFGLLFSIGYVITIIRLNLVGFATADGGFSFQKDILSDTILILPFALFQFVTLILKKTREDESMLAVKFFASVAIYSFILAVLYFQKNAVSHYTALKVSYIAVPVVWIFFLMFLSDRSEKIKNEFSRLRDGQWRKVALRNSVFLFSVLVFYVGLSIPISRMGENELSIFPVARGVTSLILDNHISPVITREQFRLLDLTKEKHADFIEDGRLFIAAPAYTALWVFAYSDIWPRTYSLVPPEGPTGGAFSQMSFFSTNIANYGTWLKQDRNHSFIYFNTGDSDRWAEKSGFNQGDYEEIERVGNNTLFKLKPNVVTSYINYTENALPEKTGEAETETGSVEGVITLGEDQTIGIVIPLDWKKARKNSLEAKMEIYDCKKRDKILAQSEIILPEEKHLGKHDRLMFMFSEGFPSMKKKEVCYRLDLEDFSDNNSASIDRSGVRVINGYEYNI